MSLYRPSSYGRRGIEDAARREADLERWLISFDGYQVATGSVAGDYYIVPSTADTGRWVTMAEAIAELLVEHPEADLTKPEQM